MKNVTQVSPRAMPPAPPKCPRCGSPDLELRPDSAYLCKKCFYTTKPRLSTSLLQSWTHSFFNIEDEGPPSEELVFGGKLAGAGGVLFLLALGLAIGPFQIAGVLGRILAPTAPSELAFIGGVTVVAVLGLVCLFAGYTMSRGDPKAWRAILPVGLIGLILGIVGPGGAFGILGGGIAAIGGYIGREV
ncbi:MAG: TFIIB-type zinc ribbon-containing protein [Methanobacteriota archaeon]|nr:MAG: TFIIB-type zinc ribbon-containing protein [Euryarchaeota archaeon]